MTIPEIQAYHVTDDDAGDLAFLYEMKRLCNCLRPQVVLVEDSGSYGMAFCQSNWDWHSGILPLLHMAPKLTSLSALGDSSRQARGSGRRRSQIRSAADKAEISCTKAAMGRTAAALHHFRSATASSRQT